MKLIKEESHLKITNKKPDQKIKPYKFGDYLSKFSAQYWKEKIKYHFKKRELFLIIMQLRNGKYDMFTIATPNNYFVYKKGEYLIDPDMIREDVHTSLNSLYYSQDCSIPFKIEFDLSDLRESLRGESVVKALNPNNLKGFINSQVIEKVLKGQELSKDIQMLRTLLIINLLITAIIAFVTLKGSGIL